MERDFITRKIGQPRGVRGVFKQGPQMKKSVSAKKIFIDVAETHWAARHIVWVYEQGLIQTIRDDKGQLHFYPDDYVRLRS